MSMEEMEVSADELPDGASEAMDAPSADMPDDADMGDWEAANEPWRPRQQGKNEPRGPDYKPYTAKFDEIIAAEDLCEPGRRRRLMHGCLPAGLGVPSSCTSPASAR